MTTPTIDFTNLQEEVMAHWEDQGIMYLDYDFFTDGHIEPAMIKPIYQVILDDPMQCIDVLGYNSLSEYISEHQTVETLAQQLHALSNTARRWYDTYMRTKGVTQ